MRDCILIVFQGQDSRTDRRLPLVAMAVVECRTSDAHDDVGRAPAGSGGIDQGALAADNAGDALVVYRIAQEVWGGVQLSQAGLGPLQLLLHGGEQHVALFVPGPSHPRTRCGKQSDSQDPSPDTTARLILHLAPGFLHQGVPHKISRRVHRSGKKEKWRLLTARQKQLTATSCDLHHTGPYRRSWLQMLPGSETG